MQSLQQKLDSKTRDYDDVVAVFDRLRDGSEREVAGLITRLRLGASIASLSGDASETQPPPDMG